MAAGQRAVRAAARPGVLTDPQDGATQRQRYLIERPRAVALATEGALIGGLVGQGFTLARGLVSDDAGQFARFVPGLCGVPAERPWQHLLPLNDWDRQAIAWVRQPVWLLDRDLKAYRQHPDPAANSQITAGCEARCATETTCEPLNHVLQGLQRHQPEFLRVREPPDRPLPNNRRENDLRDMVKKRKISAGTRSEGGRQCRDTFASLKKTCRQHGLSFWEYLKDRVSGQNAIPSLGDLIRRAATP